MTAFSIIRRAGGGGRLGNPRTRALAEYQIFLGGELRVRVHDDPARDLELPRQIPRRGDAGAGLQRSFPDGVAQLILDLRAERLRPLSGGPKGGASIGLTGLVQRTETGS